MRERWLRLKAIGLPLNELAERIGASEQMVWRWVEGCVSVEEADIFEVGLALLELHSCAATA
jgi:hypothetical protein